MSEHKRMSFIKRMFFPFLIFKFNPSHVKDTVLNSIENTRDFVKTADWRGKDVYRLNMALAEIHYKDRNLFDAKLRYRIASHFKKSAVEPLLGIAYVEISLKKYNKALKYLNLALKRATQPSDIEEIKSLIGEVALRK